jgi:hypothetical protein
MLSAGGCSDLPTEYTYTRQEPAVGRRSPAVFTVRIAVDANKRTVVWAEDVRDADGLWPIVVSLWHYRE